MKMTSTKLSAQDKKDLDKYTKFLALKFTQVIVQSRLGDKVCTPCKPECSGADWFNLAVHDMPEVAAAARKCLCPETGRAILPHRVEISLRTAEGEQLALESWVLSTATDPPPDPTARVTCAVYNRMGKLLKSLLCVTRAVPAYRLSRRQCPQSYALYYRVCSGDEPPSATLAAALGEGHRYLRVGQLATPAGCLQLTVAFRTRMTIAPSQAGHAALMLDSHYFTAPTMGGEPDSSPGAPSSPRRRRVDLDKPMRAGAFVDVSKVKQYTESDFILPEEPPFSWLLERADRGEEDIIQGEGGHDEGTEERGGIQEPLCIPDVEEEDKLMEELHFPFADTDRCPVAKLAGFYRECYRAPPLQTFADEHIEADNISEQLEQFELSLPEYDEMITSLYHSSNNN